MRKLLLPGFLLCAVIAGCETKSPSGPSGNTPTTSTTTTTVAPVTTTTSSSTTSTIVLGSLVRRYTAFQPPPNVPADMTLFFELIPQAAVAATGGGGGDRQGVFGITENEYKVTGVYVMGNGTTGTVTGELGGSLNPLETGGEFKGSLTATAPSGCTSLRDFSGTISAVNLQWIGGAVGTTSNPCSPNLLTAFNTMTMLRNDASAPLPTPPTPPSTTSSTSTTTTPCAYSLSPTSDSVPSSGGTRTVAITTQPGCAWSAQTFAAFVTIQPPYGGAGPATVTYNVAPSTTARSGNLLIAGIQFPVVQAAPVTTSTTTSSSTTSSSTTTTSVAPDLVPFTPLAGPPPDYCRIDVSSGQLIVGINNQGTGAAGSSVTRVAFTVPVGTAGGTVDGATPGIPAGGPSVDVRYTIPSVCFQPDCFFTITVNADSAVTEGPQPAASQNNGASGTCFGGTILLRRR